MIKSYHGLGQVPADFPPCLLTIGNFDGIHRGHQVILRRTVERAQALGVQSAVLIFDPHPMRVVRPEHVPVLLSSIGERVRRFDEHGFDAAVILSFTAQTASLGPGQFVREVLVEKLHTRAVVVGGNFRFGHKQAGDFAVLAELGRQLGFEAEGVPPVMIGGLPASSTRVREAAGRGDLNEARRVLGRRFTLEGPIVQGQGLGSRQTVPTLNLAPESELLPKWGVYVTQTRDLESDRQWKSITNVGNRPTFNGREPTVETHLLEDFAGETPKRIQLTFCHRLRDERRFPSAASLKQQILTDVQQAEQFFREMETERQDAVEPADRL